MQVVGLVSGGKDSCYNMIECIRAGHKIIALAHLFPPNGAEMDSFMYQTVGSEAVNLYAKATGLPLYTRPIVGASKDTGSADHFSSGNVGDNDDEVEDLYKLLADVKAGSPGVEAVSVGAILSNYQRVRVESVCERLGLQVLAFLWRRDQTELLDEMLSSGLDAILIKIAAYGLTPRRHLGRRLADIRDDLIRLSAPDSGGLSPCGEGGEYETLALDCPLFKHGRLVIPTDESGDVTSDGRRMVVHSDDAFAPVCYLKLNDCCQLGEPKAGTAETSLQQLAPIDRTSQTLIQNDFENDLQRFKIRNKSSRTERTASDFKLSVINVDVYSKEVELASNENLAKLLMSKARAALNASGNELRPLLCVLTVPEMSAFASVNGVYSAPGIGFATQIGRSPPSRACVELSQANASSSNVLMSASILAMDNSIGREATSDADIDNGVKVTAMHVRSRSNWAPANIGPYSQCTSLTSPAVIDGTGNYSSDCRLLLISGQIGMDPATLEVPKGANAEWQAALSLRHTLRVARANGYEGCFGNDASFFVCFGTGAQSVMTGVNTFHQLTGHSLASSFDECGKCQSVVLPALCTGLPKAAKIEWLTVLIDSVNSSSIIDYVQNIGDVAALISGWLHRGVNSCLAVCLVNEATPVGQKSSSLPTRIAGCPILLIRCLGFVGQWKDFAFAVARLSF